MYLKTRSSNKELLESRAVTLTNFDIYMYIKTRSSLLGYCCRLKLATKLPKNALLPAVVLDNIEISGWALSPCCACAHAWPYILQCQKRPTTVSKETYYSVKRDLL